MNLFELVLKQMRQRALGTWLTTLSVLLGVTLVITITIFRRESAKLFAQSDFGYDVLIGAPGSPLQLTINTVYQIDKSPGNVPYTLYEKLLKDRAYRQFVKIAVPYVVGDSYKGQRLVGTLPKLFGFQDDGTTPLAQDEVMPYRPDEYYHLAAGKCFAADRFEAIIGSNITRLTGLRIGDKFQATHGFPQPGETPDIHKPVWTVVGQLQRTGTAADRLIFLPVISFYTIAEHGVGMLTQEQLRAGKNPEEAQHAEEAELNAIAQKVAAQEAANGKPAPKEAEEEEDKDDFILRPDGSINLLLPSDAWAASSILVRSRSGYAGQALMYAINRANMGAQAVNPASVMREFFDNFLSNSTTVLLIVAILVTVVAAVGILVSIYNSVVARLREIAIMRALGATRGKVLAIICLEATLIGVMGAGLGLIGGHALAAAGSAFTERLIGSPINWLRMGPDEWFYLAGAVVLAALAGLVPALKAYRTSVAENLVAT
jgi:putative ABC transport system permease protein